jgi:hypothetical protein
MIPTYLALAMVPMLVWLGRSRGGGAAGAAH